MEDEVNDLFAQFEEMELNAEDDDFEPNELQDNFRNCCNKFKN